MVKYPELLVGIQERIANYFGVRDRAKYICSLGIVEKKKKISVLVKEGETEGSASANFDKKVLVLDITTPSGTKITVTKGESKIVEDYTDTDEIANPFIITEGDVTVNMTVDTAPSSDTTYDVVITYLEINLIPTS